MKNRNMVRNLIVASTIAALPLSAAAGRFADQADLRLGISANGKVQQSAVGMQTGGATYVKPHFEASPFANLSGLSGASGEASLIKNTAGTTVQNTSGTFDTVQVSLGTLNVTGATTVITTTDPATVPTIGDAVYPSTLGYQVGTVSGQTGTLTVNSGAKLTGTNFVAGTTDGTTAVVNLDGAGTLVDMLFPVGASQGWFVTGRGTSTVNITNGAQVSARFSDLGRDKGASTTLNISGAGSKMTTGQIVPRGGEDGVIDPPFSANLAINITNGGNLTLEERGGLGGNIFTGVTNEEGDPNTSLVTISGANSTLKANQISIGGGFSGVGDMVVSNGGIVDGNPGNFFIISDAAFGKSTLTVNDSPNFTTGLLITANGESSEGKASFTNSTVNLFLLATIAPSVTGEFFGGKSEVNFTNSTVTVGAQIFSGLDSSDASGVNDVVNLNNSDMTLLNAGGDGDGQFVTGNTGGVNSVWNVTNGSSLVIGGSSFISPSTGTTSDLNFSASTASFATGLILGGSGGVTGGTTTLDITGGSEVTSTAGTIVYGTATVTVNASTFNAGGLSDGDSATGVGSVILTNGTLGLSLAEADALDGVVIGTLTGATGNFYTGALSGTGTINKTGTAWDLLLGANGGFTGTINISAGAVSPGSAFGAATVVNNSSPGVTQNVLDGATPDTLVLAGFDYGVGGAATLAAITQTGPLSGVTTVGGDTALTLGGLRQAEVVVFEGSSITIAPGSNATVQLADLTVVNDPLTVDPAAFLNLTDNDLLVEYDGASPISSYIDAFLGGVSILSNGDFGGLPTYLAIAEAADLGLTEFNGITVDDTTIVAKYTFVGDANLDGQVDALDYERIDLAIGNTGVFGVAQGDLNYDGVVDALDYEQVDLNIGNGVGSPLAGVFIPEPASLSLVALGAGLLGRRRRA
jgi:hypothetical protein